jgi:hypothetical protein
MGTTSLLVDQDIPIDAGTGVGDVHVDELAHRPCISDARSHRPYRLPFILDTVGNMRNAPLTV